MSPKNEEMVVERGKSFLEVLASAVHDDFRFPFFEVFAFLFAVGTFVLASFSVSISFESVTSDAVAYSVTASLLSVSLIVFILVVLKNLAYGLGSDLEKGKMQTYFSFSLAKWKILTAKLVSSVGVSLLLFLVIQVLALYILAPDALLSQFGTILLMYIANLSFPFLIVAVTLLLTLVFKRSIVSLFAGIVFYAGMAIALEIAFFVAFATDSPLVVQLMSLVSPAYALQFHYGGLTDAFSVAWTPTMSEIMVYTGASYAIVASLFVVAYVYFCWRLKP